ncbi:MAG: RsmB/NOP family class I SAM-dependent RNA methyltransferase [Acetobacteraceae bacterium]
MTPGARVEAAIALTQAVLDTPRRPADELATAFFRARRYIGAADRRAVAGHLWQILRCRRRLCWWLGVGRPDGRPDARLLLGASLLLSGAPLVSLAEFFSGARFAPLPLGPAELAVLRPLEGLALDDPAMPEAVRLEIPDCLLGPLAARFGDALEAELAALALPAPLDLRVNLLKATREEARDALSREGIFATPTPLSPWGLRLAHRTTITGSRAFRSGLIEIQDEASQIAALLVDAQPGERVADLCAGSGGKTLALAMVMQNQGHIVAADISASRLEAAASRLLRAGVGNVERHLLRADDRWAERNAGKFDRVLVDAPCTGTGLWRRRPDQRLNIGADELAEYPRRQAAIIDLAAGLVRKRGRLVYATCSLLVEENEAEVSGFLARHAEFAEVHPATSLPAAGLRAGAHGLLLTPLQHATDGFFVALLEKRW